MRGLFVSGGRQPGARKKWRRPEGRRPASFHGTRSGPCPPDLGASSCAAAAHESAGRV